MSSSPSASASGRKRKIKTKTYQEKYEIIKFCDANPGMKKIEIAQEFDIPRPTLFDILKKRETICDAVEKPDARKGSMKRIKHVSFEDVDPALKAWFSQQSGKADLRIDGEMLLVKARKFAADLGHEDPDKLTMSWIERFKGRWGIGKVLKAGGVDDAVVEWKTGKLKEILRRYDPRNIYNADESGLFWLMLPENSLGFLGQSHHGKKESKVCVTILVGANMDGSHFLPLYVIGKSKRPRAFKHVRHLPVMYSANKKAWVTADLFDEWMRKLDREMGAENRKIAMVVDNCTAHPHYQYENIELFFLPPNTTSRSQPMDGGVIKNLKFHYRRILATRRLDAAEAGTPFKWDLLDAIMTIKTAWGRVTQETVANCFRSVGFVTENATAEEGLVPEDSVPDAAETNQFRNIWNRLTRIFGEGVLASLEDYVDIDAGTVGTQELTDAEIVESVKSAATSVLDHDSEDEDVEESDAVSTDDTSADVPPTIHEAYRALDIMKRFALSVEDCPPHVMELGDKYETFLLGEMPKRLKQTTIDDFFVRKDAN